MVFFGSLSFSVLLVYSLILGNLCSIPFPTLDTTLQRCGHETNVNTPGVQMYGYREYKGVHRSGYLEYRGIPEYGDLVIVSTEEYRSTEVW